MQTTRSLELRITWAGWTIRPTWYSLVQDRFVHWWWTFLPHPLQPAAFTLSRSRSRWALSGERWVSGNWERTQDPEWVYERTRTAHHLGNCNAPNSQLSSKLISLSTRAGYDVWRWPYVMITLHHAESEQRRTRCALNFSLWSKLSLHSGAYVFINLER